ncbi:MAG: BACON domain-containing protein, partial [Acidimicrobiales bacterium]
PDQLAAAVGTTPAELPGVLERVDAEATAVLGALALARQGRKSGAGLARALGDWDGAPSVAAAEAADTHAKTCARCTRRRKVVDPLELVAEAPLIAAPAALRTPILEQVAKELTPAKGRRPADAGQRTQAVPMITPSPDDPPSRIPTAALVGAGAVMAVLLVAVLIALTMGSGKRAATSGTSTSTATTDTVAAGPVPTVVPLDTTTSTSVAPASALALNTPRVSLGSSATTAQVVLSDTTATPANWSASTVATWLTVSPASGYLSAGQSVRVTFTVDRSAAPSGSFDARVVFAGSDQGSRSASIEVVGTNRPPTPTTSVAPSTTTSEPPTSTTSPPTRLIGARADPR